MNTPRFTGNFPKVELEKSFFCQTSSFSSRAISPQRKVQFVANADGLSHSTPREPKRSNDLSSGKQQNDHGEATDSNKDPAPVKTKRHSLKSNLSPHQNESVTKRLDQLINAGSSTNRADASGMDTGLAVAMIAKVNTTTVELKDSAATVEASSVKAVSPEPRPMSRPSSVDASRVVSPPPVPPRHPVSPTTGLTSPSRPTKRSRNVRIGNKDVDYVNNIPIIDTGHAQDCNGHHKDITQRPESRRTGKHTDEGNRQDSNRNECHRGIVQRSDPRKSGYHTDEENRQDDEFHEHSVHRDTTDEEKGKNGEFHKHTQRPEPRRSVHTTDEEIGHDGEFNKHTQRPEARRSVHTADEEKGPDSNMTSHHTVSDRTDKNGNDTEEDNVCSRDMLLAVNKQILEVQTQHSEAKKQHAQQSIPPLQPQSPNNLSKVAPDSLA